MKAESRDRGRELAAGLMTAVQLLRDGQGTRAMDQCRALLERFPGSPDVLRYLGLAEVQAQRFTEAEAHLTEALRQQPGSPNLLNDLGIVRLRQQAWEEAVDCFIRALDVDPNHADALGNIAVLFGDRSQPARAKPYLKRLTRIRPFSGTAFAKAARNSLLLDDANEALRLGRRAVRLMPELAEARLTLGEALEATGRFRQAKFQYLAILRRNPRHANALTRLLSMKRTRVDPCHAAEAQKLIDCGQLQPSEQAQLHLALARYLDQRQQYDAAFEHVTAGNAISWKKQRFDSTLFSQAADEIMAVFTEEFFRKRPVHGAQSTRPIFIVGMPRSGTTLIEQILASHPTVAAGGELSTVPNLAAEVSRAGEPYPHGIRRLDEGMLEGLATRYLERLDNVSQEAAHVTDKLPFNYMHLGLIGTLFPDAAVIHCRRDPLDTCLSCHFTSFGENLLFAGELTALGRYYVDYRRMMDHWRRTLPKPPLDVQYERLVEDTEGTVRSILAFCGLGWDPACLSFYRTDRGIRTPSRWQVRQPVYSNSIGRWRHYERYLQPLRRIVVPDPSEESARS